RADLHPAYPTYLIQRHGKRLARVVQLRDMGKHPLRIHIDGVAAYGAHDRNPHVEQRLPQVPRRREPVLEIILVQDLLESDGNGLEVTRGQPAVRRKSLREDELRSCL